MIDETNIIIELKLKNTIKQLENASWRLKSKSSKYKRLEWSMYGQAKKKYVYKKVQHIQDITKIKR